MLKFCPYCGSEILRQDVKFCMSCGKSLAEFISVAQAPEPPKQKVASMQKSIPTVSAKKSEPVRKSSGTSIEQELAKCRESAEEGYQLASTNYNEITETIVEADRKLNDAGTAQVQFSRIKSSELVDKQKEELRKLTDSVTKIHGDIESLRDKSKDFSIVVYGRTMAGKSTLMEILTHGNGDSIGKGASRTTLDVRDYFWNGLKITDVPGISAFGGANDERLALTAAKSADLILFLLTDDAPQADEAEKLAQLKKFGKPILGLINIKMSFSMSRRAISLRNLQKKLSDTNTIEAILNQFKAYDKSYDQDWSGIKFVATHLLAAYQAHPCRNDDAEVFAASQFSEVEDFILDKVHRDGRFLRIKTFADSVAVPMSNIILKIYEHSGGALIESQIWLEKRYQLYEWRKGFLERSQNKIDGLYQELSKTLETEIYNFANYHYEDQRINETWPAKVKSLGFDTRYQNLLKELASECERKRKELSDELTQEISYAFSGNTKTNIELEGTTAWGEYGSAILGGVGGVGGFLASRAIGFAFPPLGIALAAVGLLGWIFSDSKETKIRKAKAKLREDLTQPSFDMLNKMHDQIIDIFNKDILDKGIDEFGDMLGDYAHMLARLGQSQISMAFTLFKNFSDLNGKLLAEAISYKGAGFISSVGDIARIPGEKMVVFAERSSLNTKEISDLLGENISVVKPKEEFVDTIINILGSDFEIDNYPLDYDKEDAEAEQAVAVFPKNKVAVTNFKLAQQITGAPIIAEFNQPQRVTQPHQVNQSTHPNNQSKSSSGGRTQSNAFKSDFKKIDEMLSRPRKSNEGIKKALQKLEAKVKQQRNADAMNQIAIYYGRIHQHDDSDRCFELAEMYAR